MRRVLVRMTQVEYEQLDYIRGRLDRSEYLRTLIAARYREAETEMDRTARLYHQAMRIKQLLAASHKEEEQ